MRESSPFGCSGSLARIVRGGGGLCQNDRGMGDAPAVLVIDDETGSRESMAIAIEKAGHGVRTFDDARKALEYLEENEGARLAICDLRMPGMDGVAFLKEVRERQYDLGVILVTAYGSIESAVEAMRIGADDYLPKPVDL